LADLVYKVEGLDCAEEVRLLTDALRPLVGDPDCLRFDVLRGKLTVRADDPKVDAAEVEAAVAATGMRAVPWTAPDADVRRGPRVGVREALCGVSGVLLVAAVAWQALAHGPGALLDPPPPSPVPLALLALATLTGALPFLPKAWYALRFLRPDINLLMVVAVTGAVLLGELRESAMVAFLFSMALLLEGWSVGRARRAITGLMDLAPGTARVVGCCPGEATVRPVAEVPVGAVVQVRPGERIPLDGTVVKGNSSVNQAPITGESLPVEKGPGDTLFAGSINNEGVLEFRATHRADDSSLARIIHLVEEAQARRAPVEQWVDRFARYYTPAMMGIALLTAVAPPLLLATAWRDSIYLALVMLLIACPCALVISTPVSIVAGIATAARRGVLIKGGAFLEACASLQAVAIDKTGTLTRGLPEVRILVPLNATEDELLAVAAAVEAHSRHPLAEAIVRHAGERGVPVAPAEAHTALDGRGATARVGSGTCWAGSHRLLVENGHDTAAVQEHARAMEDAGHTIVFVGGTDRLLGIIGFADAPRPEARAAVAGLRAAGLQVVMLTGDNAGTARDLARQTGVDDFHAELLPAGKLEELARLRGRAGRVAMVGDGVNDAPALAAADVGIAMGAAGSDAAIETADIALMGDALDRIPWLIAHGRRTLSVIRQNIALALGLKAAVLLLAFFGVASLWLAIAADMGASLLVIANALRLLRA